MTSRDFGNTPLEIVVGTHFHARHGTKSTPVFLPTDREAFLVATSKFGLLTISRHSATRKHLLLYPQGDRSGPKKPKKGKHKHSAPSIVPLPGSVSTDLTIKSHLVLTNPIGKDGVRRWSM